MSIPSKKSPAESVIVLNTLMMPEHANHFGNVHGGVVMKLVDEAAAISAMRHAQKPAVTLAVDSLTFQQPVQIGDLVTCTAKVTYTHRTSMEIAVMVHAENPITRRITHTNSAHLVFVALDSNGNPSEVPDLIVDSPEEQLDFQRGAERRQERLRRRRQQEED